MVGRAFFCPHISADFNRRNPLGNIRTDPDMIQPPPFVVCLPVGIAVAPPGIDFFRLGIKPPRNVYQVKRLPQPGQPFNFHRRMRNNFQHLLVVPHVIFERSNVEVAADNHFTPAVVVFMQFPVFGNIVHKSQLMCE